jgi:hypothetical protein
MLTQYYFLKVFFSSKVKYQQNILFDQIKLNSVNLQA